MNIQARILARKMVFTYLYEKYTAHYTAGNDYTLNEICAIDITNSALEQKDTTSSKDLAISLEQVFSSKNYDIDMTYLAKHCFENLAERGIDMEYINAMGHVYEDYNSIIPGLVDKYTSTFSYNDMDIVDRVIFLLGYGEFKILKTPKEIILNEMIELAKKYGDTGSPKLVNGILHKILSAEE